MFLTVPQLGLFTQTPSFLWYLLLPSSVKEPFIIFHSLNMRPRKGWFLNSTFKTTTVFHRDKLIPRKQKRMIHIITPAATGLVFPEYQQHFASFVCHVAKHLEICH